MPADMPPFIKSLMLLLIISTAAYPTYGQDTPVANKHIEYNNNTFDLYASPYDTVEVMDPLKGETANVITHADDLVLKMNGQPVLHLTSNSPDDDAYYEQTSQQLTSAIEKDIAEVAKQLPEGYYNYSVSNVVINTKGKVVYMELSDITTPVVTSMDGKPIKKEPLTDAVQSAARESIKNTLEHITTEPYKHKGVPSIVCIRLHGSFEAL